MSAIEVRCRARFARGIRRACVFLPILLLGGCVRGAEGTVSPDDLPPLTLTEVARLTEVDGGPLRIVEDLTLDGENRLYLAERGERTVRVVDWDGTLVTRFGATPEGSLFFSAPREVGWEGSRFWVFDRVRYQLTVFNGEEVEERRTFPSLDLPGWELPFIAVAPIPGRSALALPLLAGWVEGGRSAVQYPVLRMAPDSPVVDTLWTERGGDRELAVVWPNEGGGGTAPVAQPFDASPLRAFSWLDSTVVEVRHLLAPEPRIVVERRTLDGAVRIQSEIAFAVDPLTTAEVEAALDFHTAGWAERRNDPPAVVREIFRDALHIPVNRRPMQALLLGEEGRIWIRMAPTAASGGLPPEPPHLVGMRPDRLGGDAGGSRWIVLSPEGVPEASATFPPAFVPLWSLRERVVGVATDAEGAISVVEFRVDGLP